MSQQSAKKAVKRRREKMLLAAALVAGALAFYDGFSRWLPPENWGQPVTRRQVRTDPDAPKVELPDFASLWTGGGRNPFGDASVALGSGGKARIPLPPSPPLPVNMPPAPMVRPLDLLTGGSK